MSYSRGLQVGEAAAGAAVVTEVREGRSIEAKQLGEKISVAAGALLGPEQGPQGRHVQPGPGAVHDPVEHPVHLRAHGEQQNYAHMAPINRRGPAPVDLSPPELVEPAELRRRIEAGEWVVDLRERTAFAAGHLAGSLGFELGTNFVTYLGWLYRYGTPLTLIGETPEQVAEARRELVRIGVDELSGAATGDIDTLADGQALRSYPVTDFAGLAKARQQGPVQVLDTRRNDERAQGYVAGSQHIPLHELADRLDEVPKGEVWVYCGSGYRASVAASILDRSGRQIVLINDDYDAAVAASLEDERPAEGTGATRANA